LTDILAAIQRRPKSLIFAFTASVLIAVAALQAADLWWWREQTLKNAHARADNLAFVLSEYVRGTFDVADTAVRQLAIHGQRVGGSSADPLDWDPILSAASTALPGNGSITVTDANGTIRRSTLTAIIGQSRADEFVVKQLAANPGDELVVGTPFLSPINNRYVIPMGRRLTTAGGRFDGTIVATVMPDAYRDYFRTVDVGRDGVIWVFHANGVLLFREPWDTARIGESVRGNPLFEASQTSGTGVITGAFAPGGTQFISGFRTIGTPQLSVAVSLSESEILADWRHQRRTSALAFAALTLTLGAMLSVLFRQMAARSRIEAELGEVQRLEAERLREANERLEEALQREQKARQESETASYLKDEFLMTVSHELRTPLTAIYGWVRMLASDAVRPEQRQRALDAVERNARAQTRLIDDLLDVSRAITGKLRIDARPVNLNDVIDAAVETLRPAIDAKGIRLEPRVDAAIGPITADADRLQQVVWNLLSNAIKFTPDNGTVSIDVRRSGSAIEIAVTDSGIGIAAEFLPYVFDRFRQAESGTRRRYGGLGLGLAIVRHIAELHGGTVTAESGGEGRGSTFRVVLPLRAARPTPAADRLPVGGAKQEAPAARLDGTRVLVVDDEADARDLFTSILEAAGARVSAAGSAADAIALLIETEVDVMLSDIEMPGEDGYELLRKLRADARLDAAPSAVAVSAHARPEDRRRALDAGFIAHLAKPIEPDDLVAAIAAALGQAGVRA
jgi:signal transduction histidine kinase/ActR/RegA family two-component response regulator